MNTQPIVFLDQIGRTLLGIKKSETEKDITVENPALVLIQANPQSNQLQLQIIPLFFKEFQTSKAESTCWIYIKNNITLTEPFELSPQLISQYNNLFGNAQAPQQNEEPKVVKLFDEE